MDQPLTGHRARLRSRLLADDASALTDEGLLELLLSYAIPRRDVAPIARFLLTKFGSLSGVLAADSGALSEIEGLGPRSVSLLKLVGQIAGYREKLTSDARPRPGRPDQTRLFEIPLRKTTTGNTDEANADRSPKRSHVMFGKALLKETIALLPRLPQTESLSGIREFLMTSLHFSSALTRQRNASYIVSRMFPSGRADAALIDFAKKYENSSALRDVCFYRFCKAEPVMSEVVEQVLIPNIGSGVVARRQISDYITQKIGKTKSTLDYTGAVIEALTGASIARADRHKLTFGYRNIPLPAFAFVVHSEFPTPGIFDIRALETSRAVRSLLWNPDQTLPSLYELRNAGLINKVSEIDTVRQFTTSFSLDEAVQKLMSIMI